MADPVPEKAAARPWVIGLAIGLVVIVTRPLVDGLVARIGIRGDGARFFAGLVLYAGGGLLLGLAWDRLRKRSA